jgi:hypothetical protein
MPHDVHMPMQPRAQRKCTSTCSCMDMCTAYMHEYVCLEEVYVYVCSSMCLQNAYNLCICAFFGVAVNMTSWVHVHVYMSWGLV